MIIFSSIINNIHVNYTIIYVQVQIWTKKYFENYIKSDFNIFEVIIEFDILVIIFYIEVYFEGFAASFCFTTNFSVQNILPRNLLYL